MEKWVACARLLVFVISLVSALGLGEAAAPAAEFVYPPVNESDGRVPLYFSLIQSFSGQYVSANSITGLELALDQVNEDSRLLPDYSLHYVFTDAPCDKKAALDVYHQQVFNPPTKIGILGSGCSVSTEPTALISHYYNLNQVSCIASSPAFRNRNLFPRYFQLLPTDASLAPAYYGVTRQYGWRRVALIVQNENLFTVAIEKLKVLLDDGGVEYTEEELVIDNDGMVVGLSQQTFDANSRIFIISSYETIAVQILCEAYRLGYTYPRYTFLTIAWYAQRWWTLEPERFGCTATELEEVLEYSLSLLHLPYAKFLDQERETDTELTVAEYFTRVRSDYVNKPPLNLSMDDDLAPVCYDAMWTFALALNTTMTEFENNATLSRMAMEFVDGAVENQTFRLEMFNYRNLVVRETLFKQLEMTNFLGVSGNVSFDEYGIRDVTELIILQFRTNSSGVLESGVIGRVTLDCNFLYSPGKSDETTWPNSIPYDGRVSEEVLPVHFGLTTLFTLFSSAGIAFSIACLVFNFYFRKQTLIRLTSPNLNYMIGSGAILLYVAIILTVLPATTADAAGVLCNLTVWLTAFGYSLCYGTILVKMLRVYHIFNNPSTLKKTKLKDWLLALMVLCLVVVDLIILMVYSAVEGAEGNLGATRIRDKEFREKVEGVQERVTEYYVYICDSRARDIFLGILYGYKAFLQIIGLFLAFATRKVKVRGLDDAKEIAATIYVTSIVLAIVMVSTYTLNELINTYAAVFGTGFFIGTTVIMALVFLTKMYALYKDPEGLKVFDRTMPSGNVGSSNKGNEKASGVFNTSTANGKEKSLQEKTTEKCKRDI